MKIRYKLTTQDMKTRKGAHNEITWVPGKWYESAWKLSESVDCLCSSRYIHWYSDPLIAVLMNQVHADIENPRLWKCEISGKTLLDKQFKGGSRRVRLIKEIPLPELSELQRIECAIRCTKQIFYDEDWTKWADDWLENKDRTHDTFSKVFEEMSIRLLGLIGFQAARQVLHAVDHYLKGDKYEDFYAYVISAIQEAVRVGLVSNNKINLKQILRKIVQKKEK